MKSGKTNVATFGDKEKAQRVVNYLRRLGIVAELADESHLQRYWFGSKPLACEKVYVPDADVRQAVEELQAADRREQILHGEVRCPKCSSPRVQYPQFTRKFIMTTFVEIFCFLRLIDRLFYCMDCHYTWPPQIKLRASTDLLNWPEHGEHRHLVKKETP